jgi:drug/metabolite transporter (DMT)-like permease
MRGDLLALLMAATWAIYSVLIRPLTRRYSASRISAVVLLFGAPILVALSFRQITAQDYGSLGSGAWVAIVYSLFFSLVFTNILWFGAISRAGAPRVTALLPLQPLLGAFFAIVFLGEALAWLQVAGGIVIVGGILLTRRRPEATPVPD